MRTIIATVAMKLLTNRMAVMVLVGIVVILVACIFRLPTKDRHCFTGFRSVRTFGSFTNWRQLLETRPQQWGPYDKDL